MIPNRMRRVISAASVALLAIGTCLAQKADTVVIQSEPPGARIELNGRYVGLTPFEWKVGNWALNPHKSWVGSKHLTEKIVLTLSKEGFITKRVEITGPQLTWTSVNRANSYNYYVIKTNDLSFKLDKVGEFIGENPFKPLVPEGAVPVGDFRASGIPEKLTTQELVRQVLPAVVRILSEVGAGSGFLISDGGLVITNKACDRHV